ncbi:MAG: hypothetical protein ABFD20_02450 [Anaerolineales bacterium]
MHVIEALRRLCDADQQWVAIGQEFAALRERLADQSALGARQQAQEQRVQQLGQTRSQLTTAELELRGLQARAQEANRQLYADGNLSPRELDHLRRDAEYLARQIDNIEERVLELMDQQEEFTAQVERGASELATFEAAWAEQTAADRARYRELRTQLQALKERRESLRNAIDAQTLRLYDDLWRSKQGFPLATLSDGRCQACRVLVPREKARIVESFEPRVVTCDGCGRILIIS